MNERTDSEPSLVLVIDDDSAIRDTLQLLLEMSGFRFEGVGSGEEGLEKLRRPSSPSVILLDIMMPGMDGFQFMTAMKKILSEIPVIILTAAGTEVISEAKKMGANEVISKPIDFESLVNSIRRLTLKNSSV